MSICYPALLKQFPFYDALTQALEGWGWEALEGWLENPRKVGYVLLKLSLCFIDDVKPLTFYGYIYSLTLVMYEKPFIP